MKIRCFLIALGLLSTACSPFYTWGYAPTIHPDATQAYIYAVMAREDGDYDRALYYYDIALSRTYSKSVAAERDEVMQLKKQQNGGAH